jgi:gluconolactonase
MFKKLFAAGALVVVFASPAAAQNVIQLPDSLYTAGDTVVWVKRVAAYCEGPAWEPATGYVYFDQQGANTAANWPIWRVKPGEDTGIVWVNAYQSNGLEFDKQGRLVAAQNGRLTRYFPNGTVDSTLVTSGTNGVTFNQANDLSIGSNGAIYFTALGSAVYYLSPSRQLSTVTTNISQANGIEWLEEEKAVYVNSTGSNVVYRFDIDSVTGALINRTTFATGVTQPDGGAVDVNGNRYVASYGAGEVRVYNRAGTYVGRIVLGNPPGTYNNRGGTAGNTSNAAFGGADMKTLYITGDGGLYSIRLKIAGRPPAQGPVSIRTLSIKPVGERAGGTLRDLRGRLLPDAWRGPVLKLPPVTTKE